MGYKKELTGPESLLSLRDFVVELQSHLESTYPPNAIFIHAPTNERLLQSIIVSILSKLPHPTPPPTPPTIQHLLPNHVVVNLRQVHSTRTAFDIILNTLSGWSGETNPARWNEASGKVPNWEGREEGFEIVELKSKKRSARGTRKDLKGKKKARRQDVIQDDEDEDELMIQLPVRSETAESEDENEDESEEDDSEESTWTIFWDHSSGASERNPVGPLRDTFDYLHQNLQKILSLGKQSEDQDEGSPRRRRWIVFEHGEMLADLAPPGNVGGAPKETGMGMTFMSSIQRIGELTSPISTISISRYEWIKAREGLVGTVSPRLLDFPALSNHDTAQILTQRFATTSPTSESMDTDTLLQLFYDLILFLIQTFGKLVDNNLEDLAYLSAKFWPKWKGVIETSNPRIAPRDTAAIHNHINQDIKTEMLQFSSPRVNLSRLLSSSSTSSSSLPTGFAGTIPALPVGPVYLNSPSHGTPSPLEPRASLAGFTAPLQGIAIPSSTFASASASPSKSSTIATASASDKSLAKSLPELAKWMLLASFYAGFTSAKMDVRNFVKVDEGIARKGKKDRKSSKGKKPGMAVKATVSTELGGGKSFPLERLLAIFESILGERHDYASQSIDVLMIIATLVNLRLLARISAADKVFDGVKLKCRISRDTADMLAKNIGKSDWKDFLPREEA